MTGTDLHADGRATPERYAGSELQLFQHARRWKGYFARQLRPYVRGRVLEAGAGMGATTSVLWNDQVSEWLCLEPDPELCREIEGRVERGELDARVRVETGTVGSLPESAAFDSILYVDVLEHIESDRVELAAAAARLSPGGFLVVLAPAHQWLFSPFDAAIGHFRRYSKRSLQSVVPPHLKRVRLRYLDSAGVLASATNRFLMKQGMPGPSQLRFWDRVLVPLSTVVDPLTLYLLGKTVIGVWRRTVAR